MKVLVTGNAGFIGFHTARRLLERGDDVVGFDVVNDYYDTNLKQARLDILEETAKETGSGYTFIRENLADKKALESCFSEHQFDRVIHLAAQAGVRYSIKKPEAYVESNLVGFTNILESCRHHQIAHFVYASSSSVYGGNKTMPFREEQGVDHPLSFYAATKRANELMAHSYSHLFNLPTTGLRFFTVYGPWGRPDMALFKFTRNILDGDPIPVFNHGNHSRDFTYIDDIVEGIIRATDDIAVPGLHWESDKPNPSISSAPFRLFNIGNNNPVKLIKYIEAIEEALNKKAVKELLPLQLGDVSDTFADSGKLESAVGYRPTTTISEGVTNFVNWYRHFYKY